MIPVAAGLSGVNIVAPLAAEAGVKGERVSAAGGSARAGARPRHDAMAAKRNDAESEAGAKRRAG